MRGIIERQRVIGALSRRPSVCNQIVAFRSELMISAVTPYSHKQPLLGLIAAPLTNRTVS